MKRPQPVLAALKQTTVRASITLCWLSALLLPVRAQVVPDGSLGTLNNSGVITGGQLTSSQSNDESSASQNLFHSFQQFSLSPTDVVTFMATPSVENIISRVTGKSPSNIHGTLRILGSTANLFLINPAGIVFGPTAQLTLPGSFIATTAEQAIFDNGEIFDVRSLAAPSMLTVSAPIGLQMGDRAGAIEIHNTGHTLAKIDPITGETGLLAPHVQVGPTRGLQVAPGKTLALLGQGVRFEGGLAAAHSGSIEIGSVSAGSRINLIKIPLGFAADYSQAIDFAAIDFSQSALVNVSGVPAVLNPMLPLLQVATSGQGRLQVVGKDISLSENAVLLGQNGALSQQLGQTIDVRASGTLSLTGSDHSTVVRTGIFGETLGSMTSGDINVAANNLSIEAGAGISGLTFTEANSGAINIAVDQDLHISGTNAVDQGLSSLIATASIGSSGVSGDITVDANNVVLTDAGGIASINFAQGKSGSVIVKADEVVLSGRNRESDIPSTLAVTNYGAGAVGDVKVVVQRLSIADTAAIAAVSITDGDAGNIEITATERIDITGPDVTKRRGDAITSSAITPSPAEQVFLGIPFSRPSGNAGDVTITTPVLSIEGAFGINVQSAGSGNAGNAEIVADSVILDKNALIRGQTFNGEGGNLDLRLQDALVLKRGSRLTVESDGTGNGGNIEISAPAVVAVENSDIIASAIQGRGGNIEISARSVLGTAYRDRLTPESDINASSQFGINGTVEITNPDVDPSSGTAPLSTRLLNQEQQIAAGCSDIQRNQFVASGRGGVASNPSDRPEALQPWQDVRALLLQSAAAPSAPKIPVAANIVQEAVSWQRNHEGTVVLLTPAAERSLVWKTAQCLNQRDS